MKLTFLHAPTTDFPATLAFYRDTLGLDEAWREGEDTVAFQLPDSPVQVMVAQKTSNPAGPMYLVDSVEEFFAQHPELPVAIPAAEIPDGVVAAVKDPGGNIVYVFDQAKATPGT